MLYVIISIVPELEVGTGPLIIYIESFLLWGKMEKKNRNKQKLSVCHSKLGYRRKPEHPWSSLRQPCQVQQKILSFSLSPFWDGPSNLLLYSTPACKIIDREFIPLLIDSIYFSSYAFLMINICHSLFWKPRIKFYSHLYEVTELLLLWTLAKTPVVV